MSTGERIYVQELTEKIQQVEAERQEMIDALVEAHEAIKCWLDMNECDCEDGVHICGRPKRRRQLDQIKAALRNAGIKQ